MYLSDGDCRPCDEGCKTCEAAGCLSCEPGHVLQKGACERLPAT